MLENRWLRLLLMPVVVYLGFCVAMACFKEHLIFPVRGVDRAAKLLAPRDAEVWWNEIAPGVRTEAWFFPGRGCSATSPGPELVYFHGNGELIDDNIEAARTFGAWGISVLLVEYRGYGRSGAATGIDGIRADSIALFDRLAARPDVRKDEIVSYGFSLGAAFAAQLAAARPVASLILESPFTSLPAMARRQRVMLYLSSERLETDSVLRALPAGLPVLITHQKNDSIIPVDEGRQLAALRPDVIYVEGDSDHLALAMGEPLHGRLRQFLAKFIRAD